MTYSRKQLELIGQFRYKADQLGSLLQDGGVYPTINAAGIIRDLILSDNNGLLGAVARDTPILKNRRNRNIKFEVTFFGSTYHSHTNPPIALASSNSTICYHKELEFSGRKNLSRDDFLALPVICTRTNHYTFKDLISFIANKLGARHFDYEGGTEAQMLLHEIRDKYELERFDPVVHPILGLGSVVHTTCNRLLQKIGDLDTD